jgi:hypothetical protein
MFSVDIIIIVFMFGCFQFVSVINIQQLDTVEGEEEEEEHLSNIHTVSDVLDNTVHNDEDKHLV